MVMVRFMRHVLGMPGGWSGWVLLLLMTNMAAVFFLPRVEAWVVLGGLGLGALLQMGLFARHGFVRLLGVGHLHWLPMVAWLVSRLDGAADAVWFHRWLLAVIALCGVSLVIDVVDVWRYWRGDRSPTVVCDA